MKQLTAIVVCSACDKKGMMVGIPTIEVFIAPNEDSINRLIVCDVSCSGGVGIIDEPIH